MCELYGGSHNLSMNRVIICRFQEIKTMNTFYSVICIMVGAVIGLLLSNMTVHPWISDDRTSTGIMVSILCIVLMAAVGIAFVMFWGYSAIGYLVGVLLVFMPYVRTTADRNAEKQSSDSE